MIASYLINEGYPLNCSSIPSALIECLNMFLEADDHKGASIVEFLSMNGADLSLQVKHLLCFFIY